MRDGYGRDPSSSAHSTASRGPKPATRWPGSGEGKCSEEGELFGFLWPIEKGSRRQKLNEITVSIAELCSTQCTLGPCTNMSKQLACLQ